MDNKVKIKAKNQKFCSLCSRVIRRGEECYTFQHEDNRGKGHFGMFNIHLDCSDKKDSMHNLFFRENVKRKPARRGREAGKNTPPKNRSNDKDKERLR